MIDMLGNLAGILGAIFFAICALPQVIKAIKTKSTKDISYFYIAFSICGNIFSGLYIFYTNYTNGFWQYPQYFNYTTALSLIIILLFLKYKYDNVSELNDNKYSKDLEKYNNEKIIKYSTTVVTLAFNKK